MQQDFRFPQAGCRIQLLGVDGMPAFDGFEAERVTGPLRRALAALPPGSVLGVPHPSARELLAGWMEGATAPPDLVAWQSGVGALLRQAARDSRVVPISRQVLLTAPAQVAADLRARQAGARAVPAAVPPSPVMLLAELALCADRTAHAVEARFAEVGVGLSPLAGLGDLLEGARGLMASLRDGEQQLLERRIQLAEHEHASAALLKLAQDQLIATRGAAAAAHADLRARLGEGPLPPLPGRDRDEIAAELARVLGSTSWRLTAPLRRLVDRLRR